jgi:cell division septation protein DedD
MLFQNKRSDDDMDRFPFKTTEEPRKGTISPRLVIGLLTPFLIVALFLFLVSRKLSVSPAPTGIETATQSPTAVTDNTAQTVAANDPSPSVAVEDSGLSVQDSPEMGGDAAIVEKTEAMDESALTEEIAGASQPSASNPDLTFFQSLKDAPDTQKEIKTASPVKPSITTDSASITMPPKMPQATKTASTVKDRSQKVLPILTPRDRGPLPSRGKIDGPYVVQVGSFQQKNDAEQLAFRLTQGGYDAYIAVVNIPDRGIWHRVRVGHYPDRSEAGKDAEKLSKNEHLSAFVTSNN